jgi:hypothetical protein
MGNPDISGMIDLIYQLNEIFDLIQDEAVRTL